MWFLGELDGRHDRSHTNDFQEPPPRLCIAAFELCLPATLHLR